MHRLVFATNNAHKLSEIRQILGDRYDVVGLADIGCHDDIPEDSDTFEGNAEAKARWVKEHYGIDCLADDSGLEVDALGGAPGVHSARYAGGAGHDAAANNAKLLAELEGCTNRTARFRTVIALVRDGVPTRFFSGSVEGSILTAPRGTGGFGYDPLFVPDGLSESFAEITARQKNEISHRGRALNKLVQFLDNEII